MAQNVARSEERTIDLRPGGIESASRPSVKLFASYRVSGAVVKKQAAMLRDRISSEAFWQQSDQSLQLYCLQGECDQVAT